MFVIVVEAVAVVVVGGFVGTWLMQGGRVYGSVSDKECIMLWCSVV